MAKKLAPLRAVDREKTYSRINKLLKKRGLSDLKLDVGAGEKSSDSNFLTVDLYTAADIQADMADIPLPDNTVDAIFSSNALEHVGKYQVVPILKEWYRLLKPGGKMQLLVPDLEWACKWWVEHQTTDWSMDIIYGHQKHDGEYHKTGFNTHILWNYLLESGDWYIHAIYYKGGESSFEPLEDGRLVTHVNQRLIVAECQKKYEGFVEPEV